MEALYVPDFGASLLSVLQLNKDGYNVIFYSRTATAYISLDTLTEQPHGRCPAGSLSYILLGSSIRVQAHLANADSNYRSDSADSNESVPPSPDSDLAPGVSVPPTKREDIQIWHQHLAHLNFTDIRKLLPKQPYIEKKSTNPAMCDICIKAKAKEKFQRKIPARRASKPLVLIHSHMCGPLGTVSQSGRRYYILYIDDFSRYSWVCFLCSKALSEVCKVFRNFKTLVELQLRYQITRFRCDNGKGEFDNEAFQSILLEYGIMFEPSPPYSQHKNSVWERMVQTHNAKVRAMLLDSCLPASMCADVTLGLSRNQSVRRIKT